MKQSIWKHQLNLLLSWVIIISYDPILTDIDYGQGQNKVFLWGVISEVDGNMRILPSVRQSWTENLKSIGGSGGDTYLAIIPAYRCCTYTHCSYIFFFAKYCSSIFVQHLFSSNCNIRIPIFLKKYIFWSIDTMWLLPLEFL